MFSARCVLLLPWVQCVENILFNGHENHWTLDQGWHDIKYGDHCSKLVGWSNNIRSAFMFVKVFTNTGCWCSFSATLRITMDSASVRNAHGSPLVS